MSDDGTCRTCRGGSGEGIYACGACDGSGVERRTVMIDFFSRRWRETTTDETQAATDDLIIEADD